MVNAKRKTAKTTSRRKKASAAAKDQVATSVQGAQLRKDRLARGWSVRHLAEESGLAISTISKIENNKMVPTVDLYSRLLKSLGHSPEWFYDAGREKSKQFVNVLRLQDQENVHHPTVSHKILFGRNKSDVVVLRQIFPAQIADENRKLMAHAGNELVYVIRGRLQIRMHGRESIVLNPEDTIHFSSTIPHFYEALDGADCEVLLVWRRRG